MRTGLTIKIVTAAAAIAVLCLLPAKRARADVFEPVSKYRKVISLNGIWKYNPEDAKEFSKPEYDDAKWAEVTAPAVLKNGGRAAGAGWYRKSFNLKRDTPYEWLRFERILDEGEIWLNGVKLINPKFESPLEDMQAGVYAHAWMIKWPEVFQAGDLLKYGRENTLAVRVTADAARAASGISFNEEAQFKGVTGIAGNVELIGHPATFIRAAERIAPKEIGETGLCEHVFRVVIATSAIGRRPVKIKLSVFSGNGELEFEKTNNAQTDPNGSVTEFRWRKAPRFENYRAVLRLEDAGNRADEVALSFHGTLVQTSGSDLYVNGQPFRIKGVEGLPGLIETGGGKASTLKTEWMKEDMDRLAGIGVNTLRAVDPPTELMREAALRGIMVVPVIRSQLARSVLALRDFKNALYWDIDSDNLQDIASALPAIAALDPYHRPISYSGAMDLDYSGRANKLIAIRGVKFSTAYNSICGNTGLEQKTGRPIVLIDWSAAAGQRDGYEAFRAEPELRRSWKTCVEANKTRGAFYSFLSAKGSNSYGLRLSDSIKWNTFMPEVLKHLFGEFEVSTGRDSYGGSVVEFSYDGLTPAIEARAYLANGNKTTLAKRESMRGGQSLRINIAANEKNLTAVRIEYETNGGIPRVFSAGGDKPVFNPEAASLSVDKKRLIAGRENKLRLTINGGADARAAEVSIATGSPGTKLAPARRGVSIPANERVSVPFSVTPGGKRGAILLTAIIRYKDYPGEPQKIYFPLTIEGKK
ncbi:MAG: hypothetical protein WCX65_09205 [bacterium]